jgi:hypothetical protein
MHQMVRESIPSELCVFEMFLERLELSWPNQVDSHKRRAVREILYEANNRKCSLSVVLIVVNSSSSNDQDVKRVRDRSGPTNSKWCALDMASNSC